MQDNANNYGFGRMTKDLFGNEVDNNSINDIELYPYENYNDVVLAELRLHEENVDNPHQVTCNQIKAVSLDVDQTSIIDSTEKAVARKNIGLDRVQNTSDTDEPILDSDLKFTSGGAYQLKQATIEEFKISRAVEGELNTKMAEVNATLASHMENTSNPHNVTAEQLELGLIENKSLDREVIEDSDNYITGGAVKDYVDTEINKIQGNVEISNQEPVLSSLQIKDSKFLVNTVSANPGTSDTDPILTGLTIDGNKYRSAKLYRYTVDAWFTNTINNESGNLFLEFYSSKNLPIQSGSTYARQGGTSLNWILYQVLADNKQDALIPDYMYLNIQNNYKYIKKIYRVGDLMWFEWFSTANPTGTARQSDRFSWFGSVDRQIWYPTGNYNFGIEWTKQEV